MNKKQALAIVKKGLKLLKDVPEDQWLTGTNTNSKNKCCANGHYNRLTSSNPNDYSNENCGFLTEQDSFGQLDEATKLLTGGCCLYEVNDRCAYGITLPTPKERVLYFLKEIIKENGKKVA